jgi:acetyl-CoA synthetase
MIVGSDAVPRGQWHIPERYNIGVDVCDRHSEVAGPALIVEDEHGATTSYSFRDLKKLSNRLANFFSSAGLNQGDRVAILLPQSLETAVTHIAAFKSGLISVPLFSQFGEDALRYRLGDCAARLIVTDAEGAAKLSRIRDSLPNLITVLSADKAENGALGFHTVLASSSEDFDPVETGPDDPAIIIYTSGTTGSPKGALHGHRVLLAHLPGVELPHNHFPKPGDLFWTPADWAWIGGLFDVLMPAWHHGVTVLARRFSKFDPQSAIDLMKRHKVRNAFLPPTALKLMRQMNVNASGLALRTISSGGETLGRDLEEWVRSTFGVTINEFYGQTECNLVIGNCSVDYPVRAGSMGKAIPGHQVAIIDDDGQPVMPKTVGTIAVHRPDPGIFLSYWNKPVETQAKFSGDWLLTGDMGYQDEDGYFWYVGRADDIITSAGYRIGPSEIEECLIRHPAIAQAAVIGAPDPVRTEVVMAFLVLRSNWTASAELKRDIQSFVKDRVAAYQYPRRIAFVKEIPMTATGKIIRKALRAMIPDEEDLP